MEMMIDILVKVLTVLVPAVILTAFVLGLEKILNLNND
jgi:hypothetical protein